MSELSDADKARADKVLSAVTHEFFERSIETNPTDAVEWLLRRCAAVTFAQGETIDIKAREIAEACVAQAREIAGDMLSVVSAEAGSSVQAGVSERGSCVNDERETINVRNELQQCREEISRLSLALTERDQQRDDVDDFDEGALLIVLDEHGIGRKDISLNARVCVLHARLTHQRRELTEAREAQRTLAHQLEKRASGRDEYSRSLEARAETAETALKTVELARDRAREARDTLRRGVQALEKELRHAVLMFYGAGWSQIETWANRLAVIATDQKPNEHDTSSQAGDTISASEAVYAILGGLTSSDTERTFSAHHMATEGAEIAERFCRVHGLEEPRHGWDKRIVRGWLSNPGYERTQ